MYEDDHAPLGEVAFRAEPRDLLHSAQSAWEMSLHLPPEIAAHLDSDAQRYEGFARTMQEIRSLPELPNSRLVDRVRRYT